MWGFLALIIIVSIALGISLHDALWGIIAFCAGGIVLLIVSALFGYGIFAGAALIKRYNTPQAKAIRKIKRKRAASEAAEGLFSFAMVLLWVSLPILSCVLLAAISNVIREYAGIDWLASLIGALAVIVPILILIGILFWYGRRLLNKKHTTKK